MKKLLGVAIIFLLLSTVSYGQLVTIRIEATVNYLNDYYNLLQDNVALGSIITGTYTYDTSTPDSSSSLNVGDYIHSTAPAGVNWKIGDLIFKTNPDNVNFVVHITNNYQYYVPDYYGISSRNNVSLPNGVEVESICWELGDFSGNALSDALLPTTAPVLLDWPSNWNILSIGGGLGGVEPCYEKTFYIQAEVYSAVLVPEPLSILLFGCGLLTLRRRK